MPLISIVVESLHDFPIYALLTISFFLSFRVLDFPDLAMDASFALGMAVLVRLLDWHGVEGPVGVASLGAMTLGFLAGATSAVFHQSRVFGLGKLLAGLVVSYGISPLAFRLNHHAISQGLYNRPHEINTLKAWLKTVGVADPRWAGPAVGFVVLCLVAVAVGGLLNGRLGLFLRIAGHRPQLLIEGGRRPLIFLVLGLGTANALSALAGCLRAAIDNYSDILTFGTFLVPLAGVLVGERVTDSVGWLRRRSTRVGVQLVGPLVGALAISVLMQLGIRVLGTLFETYNSVDIRLVIGVAVLLSAARFGRPTGPGRVLNRV